MNVGVLGKIVQLTLMFKVCSPEDMVGFTESAKCAMIRKILDDAYRFNCKSDQMYQFLKPDPNERAY